MCQSIATLDKVWTVTDLWSLHRHLYLLHCQAVHPYLDLKDVPGDKEGIIHYLSCEMFNSCLLTKTKCKFLYSFQVVLERPAGLTNDHDDGFSDKRTALMSYAKTGYFRTRCS